MVKAPLQIVSPSNQTIKDLVRLKDRKSERAERSFVVEGRREIERALSAQFKLEELYFCLDETDDQSAQLIQDVRPSQLAEVSKAAFSKVATRDGSDGLLAVFAIPTLTQDDIIQRACGKDIFLLAMENVEKPGNLGAVLRTADGAGVHGVILLGSTVDTWNSNVIRSSLGAVFSVPVLHLTNNTFFELAKKYGTKIIAAALTPASRSLFDASLSGPVSIVLGSEARGISSELLSRIEDKVIIPMNGVCDSLNVSVAAGVFAYEVIRQRATLT